MKRYMLISLTLLVIAAWLVSPFKVLAQDATPTEEPAALPTEVPTEVPTELPPPEPVLTPTDVPAELPGQTPPDANVVLLDSAGNVVPSDSPQAAEIFSTGDPMFCPAGAAFGAASCASFTTIEAALVYAATKSSGTIYVESTYTNPSTAPLFIDGNLFGANTLLTIAGGYCFSGACTGTLVGQSMLTQALAITGWGTGTDTSALTLLDFVISPNLAGMGTPTVNIFNTNNVAITDTVVLDNSEGDGVMITNSGNVKLHEVDILEGQIGNGIMIGGGQNITIEDSSITSVGSSSNSFTNNGLVALGTKNLTISNSNFFTLSPGGSVTSSGNAALISGVDGLTIKGTSVFSTFGSPLSSEDSGNGLFIAGTNNISISGVYANENVNSGIKFTSTGNGEKLSIKDSYFNENNNGGIVLTGHIGDVQMTNVQATENLRDGSANLLQGIIGNLTIKGGDFGSNGWGDIYSPLLNVANGLEISQGVGNVKLENIQANENTGNGLLIDSYSGNVTILGSDFSDNGLAEYYPWWDYGPGSGMKFSFIDGGITLNNTSASSNAGDGFQSMYIGTPGAPSIGTPVSTSYITISNGDFSNNGGDYLSGFQDDCYYGDSYECESMASGAGISTAATFGNITLKNVAANDNYAYGFESLVGFGNLNISSSDFNGNGHSSGYSPAASPALNSFIPFEIPDGIGVFDFFRMGNVYLDNVKANENYFGGAVLGFYMPYGPIPIPLIVDGTITVKNSDFSENDYVGLEAAATGLISIYSTIANENYGDGVVLWSPGGAYVNGLESEWNWGDGIHILGNEVPASPTAGNISQLPVANTTICNSVIAFNDYSGVYYTGGGTLFLANNLIYENDMSGWGDGDVYVAEPGVLAEMGPTFCMPKEALNITGLGPIIVPVEYVEQGLGKLTGATFESARNMIFVLRTLNPDDSQIVYATFTMGAGTVKAGTSVSMTQVDSGSLPAALPDGAAFVGPAFTMTATDPESSTLTETLLTNQVKIKLADGYSAPKGQKLSVQVYANGVWTALDTQVSGQFVYAYTNLLGTFVLATIPQ